MNQCQPSQGTSRERTTARQDSKGEREDSAQGSTVIWWTSHVDAWVSGSFGAAHHCDHQSTSDGLSLLFWTIYWNPIYSAHWRIGAGAELYQRQDGKSRLTAFGSRTLTTAKRNCHLYSSKLEFLALKWAITELSILCARFDSVHR